MWRGSDGFEGARLSRERKAAVARGVMMPLRQTRRWGIVVARSRSGAAPRCTTAIRPAQEHGAGSFQEDSTMNISDSICPDCGGLLEVRRQGAARACSAHSAPGLLTTCLPDFLNDATSYRVTVISGDVDNSAHGTGGGEPDGRLRCRRREHCCERPAGLAFTELGIRGRADAGDACRGRTGVQDRAAISVVIHGAPCGQYPREGVAARSGGPASSHPSAA